MTSVECINKLKLVSLANIHNYRATKNDIYLDRAIKATVQAIYIHRQPKGISYV